MGIKSDRNYRGKKQGK